MLVAHISDFHVLPEPELCYGFSDTRAGLARAVAAIEALAPRPDLVVCSGDLVDEPSPAAYATLRAILDGLSVPFVLIPGNHDDRRRLAEAFPDHAYLPPDGALACFTRDYAAFRLVAFDAVVAGSEQAEPSTKALAWLSDTLAEQPGRPVMLVMHHPPIPTGIAFMDAIQPPNFSELETVVRAHPQVRLILCGHVHRAVDGLFAGARMASAGSTGHQFALLTDLDEPPRLTAEPALVRLHLWRDGEATSFVTPVDRSFATAQFAGMDAERWKTVREGLRAGHARSAVATNPSVET